MTNATATRIAAATGLLAVVLGAFGAHALKQTFAANHTESIWEKAVFYHLIHAVMLYVLAQRKPLQRLPWFSFLCGIILFSGSLYVLAYTNIKGFGAITPFGGVSFMVGWICLLVCAKREEGN